MKSQWKSCATAALISILSLSAGCRSLPWLGNRKDEPATTAQQYAAQTPASIQYDRTVDLDTNYQLSEATSSAAPSTVSSRSSSGFGSRCH